MDKAKQRIAIAEYCGWKDVRGHMGIPPEGGMLFPYPEHHEEDWRLKPFRGLPDYVNDLNAMHEAEKCLPKYPKNNYGDHGPNKISYSHLLEVELCPKDRFGERDNATLFQFIHATAAQKAKAFLRTIGKWEE